MERSENVIRLFSICSYLSRSSVYYKRSILYEKLLFIITCFLIGIFSPAKKKVSK